MRARRKAGSLMVFQSAGAKLQVLSFPNSFG